MGQKEVAGMGGVRRVACNAFLFSNIKKKKSFEFITELITRHENL